MPECTKNSTEETVFGNLVVRIYDVDSTNGLTLTTDLAKILIAVTNTPAEVTKLAATAGVITITTTGSITGAKILVIGQY